MEALLPYYERELAFLRQYSRDFADRYPKIAARLAISGEQSDDPHVERMIDSFALLGARINKKLEDEYPEFAEALFEVLYPHYLRPFPSCSIAQFSPSVAAMPRVPVVIPRGTPLESREIRGVRCRFRTAYDVTLAPVAITRARYRPVAALPVNAPVLSGHVSGVLSFTFETTSPGLDLNALGLDALRVYLHGEQSFIAALADCIFIRATAAYVETGPAHHSDEAQRAAAPAPWTRLASIPIEQTGFADDQALIDYPARSHPAYRLLTEYFAFPEKFDFVDFGLAEMLKASGPCRRMTLHVVIGQTRGETQAPRLVETLAEHHLRLFATPVVNLFSRRGEPIRISHEAVSYPVVADARHAHAYEVYSIDALHVVKESAEEQAVEEFRPFYALHHDEPSQLGRYWFARRNARVAQMSPGYETELSVVDAHFSPAREMTSTVSLELACTNRDLPARLAIGLEGGDLFAEPAVFDAPVSMLCRPTPSVRIERGASMHWRLISHLALSEVSLLREDLSTLKELLVLYDLRRTPASIRHIEGIVALEERPAVVWLPGKPFATFVRGTEVRLTVDETHFVGTSLASFVRALDTFFGLYVGLNSFVQLVAVSKRTGEEIMRCKPRSADSMLA
jgi:type VI secretion system protein ImpG